MRKLLLFALGSIYAGAQPFTFGVKLGVPANDFLNTVQSSNFDFHSYTNRYIVGATGELRLPFGLGVEVDALYRHYNFQTAGTLVPAGTTLTVNGRTGAWEFPVLAKYRFPTRIVRPFVDAGAAWDTLQGFKQAINVVSPVPIVAPSSFNQPAHSTTMGFVIGGGLDIHVPFVHVSPEVRYTHWGTQHFTPSTITSGIFSANTGYSSNQDQVEVLVGITF
jgi:hypothetical protein